MGKAKNTGVEEKVERTEDIVSNRDSVTVTWRGGSREYTRAAHGENFEALAAEFAEKKKGTLV